MNGAQKLEGVDWPAGGLLFSPMDIWCSQIGELSPHSAKEGWWLTVWQNVFPYERGQGFGVKKSWVEAIILVDSFLLWKRLVTIIWESSENPSFIQAECQFKNPSQWATMLMRCSISGLRVPAIIWPWRGWPYWRWHLCGGWVLS